MFAKRSKPINRKRLFIRLYVMLMTAILLTSLFGLLGQSVRAKAREEIPAQTEPAQGVTIRHHGKTRRTTATGETAAQLLDRLGLEVSGEDLVSHDLSTPTFEGMVLTVDRVVTRQETYAAAIPHKTEAYADGALPQGRSQVLLAGEDGELLRTAQVTYVNGAPVRTQILSETVTRHPVTEILGLGAGEERESPGQLRIADGYIYLPTGEVLTYSGTDTVRATAYTHTDKGCDGDTATGTNVRRGTVAVDPRYIPYGTRMFITTSNGKFVYGIAVAEDCGGDIKGDRMDLYFPTYEECREFGRRVCTIYYLD